MALALALTVGAAGCSGGDDTASTTTTETTSAARDHRRSAVLDQDRTRELQETVEQTVEELGVPGAAVLVTTVGDRWETQVGVSETEHDTPLDPDVQWPVRDITTSFVTTMALQLAQEGKLSLDDPVSTWIDGVPNGDRVTVGQLLDMSSGLPEYTTQEFTDAVAADPARQFTIPDLLAFATEQPPRAEPGTDRVDTATNAVLLGRIVEKVTGRPFDEELSDRILDPLRLEDTVYPLDPADWDDVVVGYARQFDGTLAAQPSNPSVFGPAGAMVSTTEDLAVWSRALATGELLDSDTQAARLEGGKLDEGPAYDSYGQGIGELDGWWGYLGEGDGFSSLVMYDIETDTSVVVVMNASQLGTHGPTTVFERIAPLLIEE